MLTIYDAAMSRRTLLRAGTLGLGGLTLPQLFSLRAQAAESGLSSLATGRSVVFLFQQGGPSQFETFDPKPEAPLGIRTITGTIATSIPGVHFGDALPQLATRAGKLTLVRSFQTGNATHNIEPLVGPGTQNTNVGSLYSRIAGATHPVTAMPTSAVLFPQSVCQDVTRGQARGDLSATGSLGAAYAPFVPGGGGPLLKNLRLGLPSDRFHSRQQLRSQLDLLGRAFESEAAFQTFDKHQEQACGVLLSGSVADALDLSRESADVVDRYDTARYVAADNWDSSNRGKRGYYTGHAKSLGKAMLLARRLCEAGCGFVTVHCDYEGVWDMHADRENLNIADGMMAVGRSFDHAVSAFIDDIEQRGLSDRILLVACGEMGRTPRINRNGGRDHWAKLAPMMLYGGGMDGGRVIGQSSRDGGEPATDPLTSANLISTILHAVCDVTRVRLQPALNTIAKLGEAPPFPGLFS